VKKRVINFAIIISWILITLGLLVLFIFIMGKSFGLIHSPVWVDYIPHMAGGATLLGIAIQTGKTLQQLKDINADVNKMDKKLNEVVKDTATIKSTVDAHDKQIQKIDDRVYENSPKKDRSGR